MKVTIGRARLISAVAALAFMGAAVTGCGSSSSSESGSEPAASTAAAASAAPSVEPVAGSTVGASMINMRDPDLVVMGNAMQQAADASGDALVLLDTKGDVATELQLIEDMITRQPAAIIMQALDGTASQSAAKAINDAGIPLFTLSTDFADGNTLKVESYIGVDDTEAGKLQAAYANGQLPDGGTIAYLVGTYGASWTDRRLAGFMEDKNANIEIAVESQANGSRDEGKRVMEDILQRFPAGELNGLVCHNDEMCIGAASAIKEAGREGDFKFVIGVDGTQAGYAAIQDGGMTASVRQDSAGQGAKAIEVVNQFLAGQAVDPRYFLPFELVDADNVDQFIE